MRKFMIGFIVLFCCLTVCGCMSSDIQDNSSNNSGNLKFSLNRDKNSYTVKGMTSDTTDSLIIPAQYNGKDVTAIADRAFRKCSNLKTVFIPDTVTSIGYRAFQGCTGLASIVVPNSVSRIDGGAFEGCAGLTEITIPFVGQEVDSKYNYFFGYIFGSFSGNDDHIPDGLVSVNISQCTSIPDNAFKNCDKITQVCLPNGLTKIGESAFKGCDGITQISLPNGLIEIGESAFEKCSNLTNVEIPAGVQTIGNSAFSGCKSLVTISMPDGLTTIGRLAFEDCKSLVSVSIPDSVGNHVGWKSFSGCDSLTDITFPSSMTTMGGALSGCTGLHDWRVPDQIQRIEKEAFKDCVGFVNLEIPDSVTYIGKGALRGCTSLKSLVIPFVGQEKDKTSNPGINDDLHFGYIFGADASADHGTYVPHGLKKVVVKDGSLFSYAFAQCYCIQTIELLSEKPMVIRTDAFWGCSCLRSITIPESIIRIGSGAFEDCHNLKEIIFTGTKTQWQELKKGTDWDKNTPNYTVYCQSK